jgi:iron complex outermembrane receptor protein
LAGTYVAANIRAGFKQNVSHWKFSEFAKIDNVFDRAYIGSVIINDSNSRFFEPSPGRNYMLGLNAQYQF